MSTVFRHTGTETGLESLQLPVFDYVAIQNALKAYKRPRDRMTTLLRNNEIVRIKKGLYVRGRYIDQPPRELIANLVYGPSYVSLHFALRSYGMIPEHVRQLASVTCGKSKLFRTPLGDFSYRSVPARYYRWGVRLVRRREQESFLIATPEKALADAVYFTAGLTSVAAARSFLLEDLRIERESLATVNVESFAAIAHVSGRSGLRHCARALAELSSWKRS